jgi:hypothetical protein
MRGRFTDQGGLFSYIAPDRRETPQARCLESEKRQRENDYATDNLTILGSALIVTASVQFADAAQRHHGKADRAVTSQQQLGRNADAYAAWPAPAPPSDWSRYSGGYSAPAGR